jgi:hypothetical protein
MSNQTRWAVGTRVAWLLGLAACGGVEPGAMTAPVTVPDATVPHVQPSCWTEDSPPSAEPVWTLLGEGPLGPRGQSDRVVIEAPAATASNTLRVVDSSGGAVSGGAPACVQLAQLDDPTGTNWVAPSNPGPYCIGCPQRVSLGLGYGLFVLPSNDQPLPLDRPLGIRAAAFDCSAAAPDATPVTRLRIEALVRPELPADRTGVLALGLAFGRTSPLADEAHRAAVVPEALRLVEAMLAPGHLRVQVVRTRLVDVPAPLELVRNDNGPLDRLYRDVRGGAGCAPPAEDGWIPIVFAGCIRITDPDLNTSLAPDGLTPGIPSGFPPPGHAHGVFLKGRSCRDDADPIDWPASLLAKLIAHELGHYLGLYHSVEADGTLDQLADTAADNIMFANPLDSTAQGFTAAQFHVMRRHPAIRW